MQPSRRRFLTGAFALGASSVMAQDEPEKLPHTLDFVTEQKRWEDLLAAEKAKWELSNQIERAAWEDERALDKLNWEAERRDSLERYQLCTELERVLLGRFMAPMDEWLTLSLYLKEPEFRKNNVFDDPSFTKEGTLWLALRIKAGEPIGKDLWLKFSISKEDMGWKWIDVDNGLVDPETGIKIVERRQVPETLTDMLWRKRDGLILALEHHFVLLIQDDEEKDAAMKTMIDGTPHLYRLISEYSEPEKATKEQILR